MIKITQKKPSVFGGACIIASVCVGAGMLALPSAGAGSWTFWSVFIITLTMIMMTISGWMLLEAFKHFDLRASFNTVTKSMLGSVINTCNNLSVYFVGGILLYAYTTTSGLLLGDIFNVDAKIASILFVVVFSAFVLHSTRAVDRISVLLIVFMILSFIFSVYGLATHIHVDYLWDKSENLGEYSQYALGLLPVALTSFGYHHSVASLRAYYQDEHKAKYAITGGTIIALLLYLLWIICIFGNLPRVEFAPVIAAEGNLDVLLQKLGNVVQSNYVKVVLNAFSMAAILSSFIGVGLGVFDYLADLFHISNTRKGRLLTWVITFFPPLIFSVIAPFGFVVAIGYAGAAATIWTCIIPGLLVLKSRQLNPNSEGFSVAGGFILPILLMIFGVGVAVFHFMNMFDLLPNYMG